jgi:tRNA A-37 threonylcarbamoyl transferase component Bud32/membrane-associated phospholipid phosphatase
VRWVMPGRGSGDTAEVEEQPAPYVSPSKRRRRPSGEPPPLPRPLQSSGKALLMVCGAILVLLVLAGLIGTLRTQVESVDGTLLRGFAATRNSALTSIMRFIDDVLTSPWTIGILRWSTLLALIVFKRFRHLFVFLGSLLLVGWITSELAWVFVRARPLDVSILGNWEGSSMPSRPAAALAVTLVGIAYSLVVAGKPRSWAKLAVYSIVVVFGLARLYLGIDHPTDYVFGVMFGLTIPLVAFRLIAPNDAFPVSYGRGRAAHLDVHGRRGDAIKRGLQDQLGITLIELKPFGLEGSGGSTPLRLHVVGEPDTYLFGKLYASTHLRADRWYKLGRTLLYGRLEDEAAFSTVRRLVQYEDYLLRVMRDGGLNTPVPYGFVEITPEREYVLVTEFLEGGQEILEADVDESLVDDGLRLVRDLWDAGIAHRDIKPSNVLVKEGRVHLIDVAFGEVRPSPWRQAVDLANMMLVLALRSNAELVYTRALQFFSPDEIGEAFAATHSVTMPSQSRSMLRRDRRNLLVRFRELAPKRPHVKIQRWTIRRVGLTAAVVLGSLIAVALAFGNLRGAGLLAAQDATLSSNTVVVHPPLCEAVDEDVLVLVAQSVPSASLLPCIEVETPGWDFYLLSVKSGSTRLFLNAERPHPGTEPAAVTLTDDCDVSGLTSVSSDEIGTQRYERVRALTDERYAATRYYVFDGGCVSYDIDLYGTGRTALGDQLSTENLGFISRKQVAHDYYNETGLKL